MPKFSETPHFILKEFFDTFDPYGYERPSSNIAYLRGPTSGIVMLEDQTYGFIVYVKTDTDFSRRVLVPVSSENDLFEFYNSPTTIESGSEVYFRKNSYFYDWILENGYEDFINTGKKFIYIGDIYDSGTENQYNILYNGMKNFVLNALPENNRTDNINELIYLYFDKIYHEVWNKLKNIWTLKDAIEIEEKYLGYLAAMYNIDLRSDNPLSENRRREYVRDLIFWLKRKGTYSSIFIIWKVIVGHTINVLRVYERWHNWDDTLTLDTFKDYDYTYFTPYSTSASAYPPGGEYAEGDMYLSTHYKVEMNLSNEPIGYRYDDKFIMSEAIIKNLIDAWETIRPVCRVSHYQEYIETETTLNGNYTDIWDYRYDGYCMTKTCQSIFPRANTQVYEPEEATTWTIDHIFDHKRPIVQFYNENIKRIEPATLRYYGDDLDTSAISDADDKDFESGYGNWSFTDVTQDRVNSLTATGTDTTTLGAVGSTCLKLTQSINEGYAYLNINTTVGQEYRLKFLMYGSMEIISSYCLVGLSENSDPPSTWIKFTPKDNWQYVVIDFEATTTSTYLFIKPGENESEIYYFDFFRCLEKGEDLQIVATFYKPTKGFAVIMDRDILHKQDVEEQEWEKVHGYTDREIILQALDSDNKKIYPDEIELEPSSTVLASFYEGIDGYFLIHPGTTTYTFSTAARKWEIKHDFGHRGVIVQAYDSNHKRIIPEYVNLGKDICTLKFYNKITGYVRLVDIGLLSTSTNNVDSVRFGNEGRSGFNPVNRNDVENEIFRTYRNIERTEDDEYIYFTVLVRDREAMDITEMGWFDVSGNLLYYTRNSLIYKPENVYIKVRLKILKEETIRTITL